MTRAAVDASQAASFFVSLSTTQTDATFDVQLEHEPTACVRFTRNPSVRYQTINATRSNQLRVEGRLPPYPLMCHSYYVRFKLDDTLDSGSYDQRRSYPAGLPMCFEKEACLVGYLYFG